MFCKNKYVGYARFCAKESMHLFETEREKFYLKMEDEYEFIESNIKRKEFDDAVNEEIGKSHSQYRQVKYPNKSEIRIEN